MKYLCLKSRLNQSGQAAIEYILVTMVVVTIAVAFMSRVIKPMGAFIQDVMGTYVSCLLETGELPKLGNEAEKKASCAEVYTSAYAKFSQQLKSGDFGNLKSNSSGSNRDPSSNSKNNSSSNSNNRKNSNNSDTSTNAGSASRGGSRYIGGSSKIGGDGVKSNLNYSSDKVTTIAQNDKSSKTSRGSYTSSSGGYNGRKEVSINTESLSEAQKKQLAGQANVGKEISFTNEESTNRSRNKRMNVEPPTPRAPAADEEFEPLGFGDYARYLLIAAIIIALVVFLGGQAFQISKEM